MARGVRQRRAAGGLPASRLAVLPSAVLGEPFPIVYDETGLPIALPESMLPVELPPMSDFRPQEIEEAEPRPPLSRAPGFEQARLDLGEGPKTYRRETNTMPQWAGSCWYYLRYLDPTNDQRFVDPTVERFWMGDADGERVGGVDLYIGGVEHAVLHLLYARFWHKILFDLGHVSTPEPFQRLYNQGYILADAFTDPVGRYLPAAEVVRDADGTWRHKDQVVTRHSGKMGKSLKNAVSPDDIYEAYGADTLRMYEMAMGPLDADRAWRPDDIVGVFRFLQRLWRNVVDETTGEARVTEARLSDDEPLHRLLHETIDSVGSQYDELRYTSPSPGSLSTTTHSPGMSRTEARLAGRGTARVAGGSAGAHRGRAWNGSGTMGRSTMSRSPLRTRVRWSGWPSCSRSRSTGGVAVRSSSAVTPARRRCQAALTLGPVARLIAEDRLASDLCSWKDCQCRHSSLRTGERTTPPSNR